MVSPVNKYKIVSISQTVSNEGKQEVILLDLESNRTVNANAGGIYDYTPAHQWLVIHSNFCMNNNDTDMELLFPFTLTSVTKHPNTDNIWDICLCENIIFSVQMDVKEHTDVIEFIAENGIYKLIDYLDPNVHALQDKLCDLTNLNQLTLSLFDLYSVDIIENNDKLTLDLDCVKTAINNAVCLILMTEGFYNNGTRVFKVNNIKAVNNNLSIPRIAITNIKDGVNLGTVNNLISFKNISYALYDENDSVILDVSHPK